MRKASVILIVLILLTGCSSPGITNNVKIEVGTSERFTVTEIEAAAECVVAFFPEFEGCELLRLWYDEEWSDGPMENKGRTNRIVLLSDFYVDSSGANGGFNPNETYINWNWILTRDANETDWKVSSWGYC